MTIMDSDGRIRWWALRIKFAVLLLGCPAAAAGAYVVLDPYVPALKSQVSEIVDTRNAEQTKKIHDTIGKPLIALADSVQDIIRSNAVDACDRAREVRNRIDNRLFDLHRFADSAKESDAKLEFQKRIVTTQTELSDAEELLKLARAKMRKLVGWSC